MSTWLLLRSANGTAFFELGRAQHSVIGLCVVSVIGRSARHSVRCCYVVSVIGRSAQHSVIGLCVVSVLGRGALGSV